MYPGISTWAGQVDTQGTGALPDALLERLGDGTYAVRYSPKAPAVLTFTTQSNIKELNGLSGTFVVSGAWPGKPTKLGYKLGDHWYSDKQAPELFDGPWQGVKTVSKWRNEVLDDWAERWEWLSE